MRHYLLTRNPPAATGKFKIVTYPGFPKSLPHPRDPIPCEVLPVPGMGLGLYATRDIEAGELVVAERPLMLVSPVLQDSGAYQETSLTIDQLAQGMVADTERYLDIVFQRMPPENQAAFMELANSHVHDGSGPLLGRVRSTNLYVGPLKKLAHIRIMV